MKLEQNSNIPTSVQTFTIQPRAISYKTPVEQKVYKIGKALFRPQIRQRQNLRNFNGFVLDVLQKDVWNLKGPDENKSSKWPQVLSFMKEAFIKQLHFQKNPQILKQIYPIQFHQLKELNLFVANIQNYEGLNFLNCPKLQKINLIYNNCTNFKALNKAHMPSVKIICIYIKQLWNGIGQRFYPIQSLSIQDFERWGFQLNELRLQKWKFDRVMMEDLSKLAKSKPTLQNIYYCRKHRIEQKGVMQAIKKKGAVRFHSMQEGEHDFQEVNI